MASAVPQSRRPGFDRSTGHVGSAVEKVIVRQIYPEYFGFLDQFFFHRLRYTHPPFGTGTVDPLMVTTRSGLTLTSSHERQN
jgi:hypothetical protein